MKLGQRVVEARLKAAVNICVLVSCIETIIYFIDLLRKVTTEAVFAMRVMTENYRKG